MSACKAARIQYIPNSNSHDATGRLRTTLPTDQRVTPAQRTQTSRENYKLTARELQLVGDLRSGDPESFKLLTTVRAKMAAQVDLLRAKVEDKMVRDSLERFIKEKKKKKKRELSPSADKRERCEKEAKKMKLHHHHHNHKHAEHRTHQPHQLQQNPKPHNFSAGKHVLHSHHHHNHSLTNGTKKNLQPVFSPPPPRKVPEQLQKKQTVPSQPPALFTFTPLKVVKAKPQEFKEKHREKDLKLKLKKENAEANVKHAELKKKKGAFSYFYLFIYLVTFKDYWPIKINRGGVE